jgi:branched-chain amino acid transport system permease protein
MPMTAADLGAATMEQRRLVLARAEARVRIQQRVMRLTVALLAVALLAFPLLRGSFSAFNYVIQVLIVMLMFTAMSSSWNIMGGFTGYISLGHNVFMVIGAYVSGMLLVYRGWSPFATVFLGVAVAMVFGFAFGLITLRTRGPAFIISTIALLLMMRLMMDNWKAIEGASGLSLPIP